MDRLVLNTTTDESNNDKTVVNCSTRKRSLDKRTERNRKKKQKRKERALKENGEDLIKGERILDLERENAILKRNVKKSTFGEARDPLLAASTRSYFYHNQNKSSSIYRTLKFNIIQFSKKDVQIKNDIGSGVFGFVSKAYIVSIKQLVVLKQTSQNQIDAIAECKKCMLMSGCVNFAYIFGMVGSSIILEYIRNDDGSSSPTLKEFLSLGPSCDNLYSIAATLCFAIHELHKKGLLHNDLHSSNIIIRNNRLVKVVDLGKATLVADPVRYNIVPGSSKQKKYNSVHVFLAYELRNKPGSYQSYETDIYSVGYNINLMARIIKNEKLALIASKMMNAEPSKRPALSRCITELKK